MPADVNHIPDKGRIWRRFLLNITLIIVLFLLGIIVGFVFRTDRIINHQHLTTARAHFRDIVLTRRWNARHGGVYVEKRDGVVSNPFLSNPDITTTDGRVFTQKNPALMTREISEYARESGEFTYHITSLIPLNPGNTPDGFEKAALAGFENGEKERSALSEANGRVSFRYMAPLQVEETCLACHARQGYKVGDVRGGISVTFDVTQVRDDMRVNRFVFIGLSTAMSLILLGTISFLVLRVSRRLSRAYDTIEHMSITDELTRLYNRRHFHVRLDEEIQRSRRYSRPLSLILMDIDHFKQVNDLHGHLKGDEVLAGIAGIVKKRTRSVDIVARYGGEELVAVLPETDEANAREVAEKLRQRIKAKQFRLPEGNAFGVTVSFGVASLAMVRQGAVDPAGQMVRLADEALYLAKEGGRNQVVVFSWAG